jgi:hypothetical protein
MHPAVPNSFYKDLNSISTTLINMLSGRKEEFYVRVKHKYSYTRKPGKDNNLLPPANCWNMEGVYSLEWSVDFILNCTAL